MANVVAQLDALERETGLGPLPTLSTMHNVVEGGLGNDGQSSIEVSRTSGIVFACHRADAVRRGWKIAGGHRVGLAGRFVEEKENTPGLHNFVRPAGVDVHFLEVPIEGLPAEAESSPRDTINDLIHPLLAKAMPSPRIFVDKFMAERLWAEEDLVGPVAKEIHGAIKEPTFVEKLNDLSLEGRNTQMFYKVVDTARKFTRADSFLAFGMPVVPEQLLATLQSTMAEAAGDEWSPPAPEVIVTVIGTIAEHARQICSIADHAVTGQGIMWEEVDAILQRHATVKIFAQRRSTTPWATLCDFASYSDLDGTVTMIKELRNEHHLSTERRDLQSRQQRTQPEAALNVMTEQIRLLKKDGTDIEPLNRGERASLNDYFRRDRTKEIDISEVRLLVGAVSGPSAIGLLQPGGCDVSPTRMSEAGKELLLKVQQELFELGDLRDVPLVALAKVLTMHMTEEDNFYIEHFGFVAFRDRSSGHVTTTLRTANRDVDIRKQRKMIWVV